MNTNTQQTNTPQCQKSKTREPKHNCIHLISTVEKRNSIWPKHTLDGFHSKVRITRVLLSHTVCEWILVHSIWRHKNKKHSYVQLVVFNINLNYSTFSFNYIQFTLEHIFQKNISILLWKGCLCMLLFHKGQDDMSLRIHMIINGKPNFYHDKSWRVWHGNVN